MNADAQAAIEWTRGRLNPAQRRYLAELPLTRHEDDRLYVHSEASHPERWRYVRDTSDAARSIMAAPAQIGFCSHIHRPALYSMSSTAKMTSFVPTADVPVTVAGPALARRDRLRGPAARQRSVGLVCDVRYRAAGTHLLPCSLRYRGCGGADPRERPAGLACRSPVCRSLGHGQAFDAAGRHDRRLHRWRLRASRRHGDAVERHPSRHQLPLLMKVPRVSEGEDPAAIVSFEMEQMILPRLRGRTCRPVSAPAISRARPMS